MLRGTCRGLFGCYEGLEHFLVLNDDLLEIVLAICDVDDELFIVGWC